MNRFVFPAASMLAFALGAAACSLHAQPPGKTAVADEDTVRREMNARTDISVDRMPLAQFAEMLSKKHRMVFKLDPDGTKRANITSGTTVTAQVKGVPLWAALRRVLSPLNLACRIEGNAVVITNRQSVRVVRSGREAPARAIAAQVPAIGNGRRQVLQILRPQVQVELVLVRNVCAPTPEQMRKIKSDLQDYLNDAADGTASVSPKVLEEKVSAAVEKHVSAAQAARYRGELEKRDAAEREVCVLNLVAILDGELCLSEKQRKSLCEVLTTNWEQGWCRPVEMAVVQGQTYVPAITDEIVEPVFDSAQMEVWRKMQKISSMNWNLHPWQVGMFAVPVADPEDDR